jgi:hypothetical protein
MFVWRSLGWILLNTLLAAALAECLAHAAERLHPAREEITFDYAPYRMLRMSRAPWPLNREGFRADDLTNYRGKFLIEFLGGSVCLGVGTNPGKTLPERLQDALRAAGLHQARVLNLCQGGASSAQELAIFLQYGLPLSPQVVFSFNGANDLMHPVPLGEDGEANLPYRDQQLRASFGHSWLSHLALARVASRLAARLPRPEPPAENAVDPERILDSYLYAVGLVRELVEARGGWHAVLLQPALHYAKPWSPSERRMWRARRPRDAEAASRYAGQLFERARARLAAWNRAPGGFFDLTHVFEATGETVYSDSVHFTGPRGYAMLAAELHARGWVDSIAARYRAWEKGREGIRWPR